MADVSFTHVIRLTNVHVTPGGPDGSISWSNGAAVNLPSSVDSGPDGLLDRNVDQLGRVSPPIVYTGYVVEYEGRTYAIFGSTGTVEPDTYFIPYNAAQHDLAPLVRGSSTGYIPTGADVSNCFATGTTILTPDGDRTIETLQPGDRVVTHDGRSTPAIWVARQTVANPRGVELGRKPVRIDAGALGPDLPDRPLTVTGDHALLFGDMLINAGTLVNGTTIRLSCRFRSCRRGSPGGMWSLRTTSASWPTAFPRRALSIMSAGPASTITTNISTSPGPTV